VLITLDTTRADHLGCYGYARPTSPNIDLLAAESLVYEQAIAPSTWTLPSHASLFTGKFVASHGARKVADGPLILSIPDYGPNALNEYRARTIAQNEHTLAGLLKSAGYHTAGVVAGPWLKRVFGLGKGFDFYDDDHITTLNGRLAADVTDKGMQWLRRPSQQPRFLFLNYFDAHIPYQPPPEFTRKFVLDGPLPVKPSLESRALERWIALYDAEILYMDFHLGRLFDGLKRLGLYDEALIIVTADHGELLGENGEFGHGEQPYQGVAHIPLIIKSPEGSYGIGREAARVQLLDVFPLVLQAAGVDVPQGIQGTVPPEVSHPIIIESQTIPTINTGGDWLAIIEEDWKYIWNSEGRHMLFNLRDDPTEQQNLFVTYPERARALGDLLHAYVGNLPEPGPAAASQVVDRATQATLKSLGYVE
jgi:arylsulfatase A-like enzyme